MVEAIKAETMLAEAIDELAAVVVENVVVAVNDAPDPVVREPETNKFVAVAFSRSVVPESVVEESLADVVAIRAPDMKRPCAVVDARTLELVAFKIPVVAIPSTPCPIVALEAVSACIAEDTMEAKVLIKPVLVVVAETERVVAVAFVIVAFVAVR